MDLVEEHGSCHDRAGAPYRVVVNIDRGHRGYIANAVMIDDLKDLGIFYAVDRLRNLVMVYEYRFLFDRDEEVCLKYSDFSTTTDRYSDSMIFFLSSAMGV